MTLVGLCPALYVVLVFLEVSMFNRLERNALIELFKQQLLIFCDRNPHSEPSGTRLYLEFYAEYQVGEREFKGRFLAFADEDAQLPPS